MYLILTGPDTFFSSSVWDLLVPQDDPNTKMGYNLDSESIYTTKKIIKDVWQYITL